ncbi:hypothetical protein ABIE51_003248 [Lysobacter sp. OAE881]
MPSLTRSDAADDVTVWIPTFAGMTLVSKNAASALDPG